MRRLIPLYAACALTAQAEPLDYNYKVPPLSIACLNGDSATVEELLAAGADPNLGLIGNETPLHTAARTGLIAPVTALLAAGAEPDAQTTSGQTPIMWAAAEGHADVVHALIHAGAASGRRLRSGFTPWFFAARNGHQKVIDVLHAHGSGVDAKLESKNNNWGEQPPAGSTALTLAIANGHFELVVHLLDLGADPDDLASGFTPLHILTWVRKPKRGDNLDGAPPPTITGTTTAFQLVDALIAAGADIDARLERGSDAPNTLGRPGSTPFLLAAQTADLPLMEHYLHHGADPHAQNEQGRTPLMAAAGIGVGPEADEASSEPEAVAAVKFLLELGADIDHADKTGDTLLHAAAYKQSPKLVELLSASGINPSAFTKENHRGWTPLKIAQGYRYGNFKPSAPTIAALEKAGIQLGATEPE